MVGMLLNNMKSGDAGCSFRLLAISLQYFYIVFFYAVPVRILVPLFHRTHLLFLGSTFLNDVTLRCNPYIMCITRSTGYFGIMHTVIWFSPINKQFLFWCGIVHWFRRIFCLCWHEITISNTSMLTGTSPATLN